MGKKVVISCGPIPTTPKENTPKRVRLSASAAFKTAYWLGSQGHDMTVIVGEGAEIEERVRDTCEKIVYVGGVPAYNQWLAEHAKDYDAFILAADIEPPGNIGTTINKIRVENPDAYIISAESFSTVRNTKADIIFVHKPDTTWKKRTAIIPGEDIIELSFDGYLDFLDRALRQTKYRLVRIPMDEDDAKNVDVQEAVATVKLFEKTFTTYSGSVAVPVKNKQCFVITAKDPRNPPVFVKRVDHTERKIYATGDAQHIPAIETLLHGRPGTIVIHRHTDDPLANQGPYEEFGQTCTKKWLISYSSEYLFPNTAKERDDVHSLLYKNTFCVCSYWHGYFKNIPIRTAMDAKQFGALSETYERQPEDMASLYDTETNSIRMTMRAPDDSIVRYSYSVPKTSGGDKP